MVYNAPNHKLYFVVSDNTAPRWPFARAGGGTVDTGIFTLNIAADGTASNLTKLVSWGGASGISESVWHSDRQYEQPAFHHRLRRFAQHPASLQPAHRGGEFHHRRHSQFQFAVDRRLANNPNFFYYIGRSTSIPPPTSSTGRPRIPSRRREQPDPQRHLHDRSDPDARHRHGRCTRHQRRPPSRGHGHRRRQRRLLRGAWSSVNFNGSIVEGSLSTANGTQTTIYTLPTNTQPEAILFEAAPVLTAGATVGYTEQGTAVVLDFEPDAERCRQCEPRQRHGVDHRGLPHRRHAELHQPERHHRQLQQRHRRADAVRQSPRSPTTRRRCARSPSPRPATIRPASAPIPAAPSAGRRTTAPRTARRHQHGERHGGRRRPGA